MNTTHLDMCCRVIETNMQYPSDEYLIKLVRIQQLTHSISITMAEDNLGQTTSKLPLTMVVQSFEEQLRQYRESLVERFSDNGMDFLTDTSDLVLTLFQITSNPMQM